MLLLASAAISLITKEFDDAVSITLVCVHELYVMCVCIVCCVCACVLIRPALSVTYYGTHGEASSQS